MTQEWFYEQNGERKGPVTTDRIKEMAKDGSLQRDTLIWREGLESWVKAKAVKGIFAGPPPLPQTPPAAPSGGPPPLPKRSDSEKGLSPPPVAPAPSDSADPGTAAVPDVRWPVIAIAAASGLFILAYLAMIAGVQQLAIMLSLLGLLSVAPMLVFTALFIFRAWKALPGTFRLATPGQAVGFLFIPFFQFYWVFIAIRGYTVQLEKALVSSGKPGVLKQWVALTACILFCASVPLVLLSSSLGIPVIGDLLAGATTAFFILWLIDAARAIALLHDKADPTPRLIALKFGSLGAVGLSCVLAAALSLAPNAKGRAYGASVCVYCHGTGHRDYPCAYCLGSRKTLDGYYCAQCGGTGKEFCQYCGGSGRR